MQHLILHIGRHKTGTSAIQSVLSQNPELLSEAGILYPDTGRRRIAHHDIADRLGDTSCTPEQDELLSSLLREIRTSGRDTVLVSSEGFQRADPERIEHFFSEFRMTVVVYLRDQLSYLESSYLQHVHADNYCGTIEEYEQELFSADYKDFIDTWQNTFGKDQLVVRIFSKALLKDGDIIRDFLQVVKAEAGTSLDHDSIKLDQVIPNHSLRADAIAFKQRFNKVVGSEYSITRTLYEALGAYSSQIKVAANLVSPELKTRLETKYRTSNLRLLKSLSYPLTALDFRTDSKHSSIEWMKPAEFHDFMEKLIEIDQDCSSLASDCYRVTIQKLGTDWQLGFCTNILVDSMDYVRISTDQSSEKLTELASRSSSGYRLPCKHFNPEKDHLALEFDQGRKRVLEMLQVSAG